MVNFEFPPAKSLYIRQNSRYDKFYSKSCERAGRPVGGSLPVRDCMGE